MSALEPVTVAHVNYAFFHSTQSFIYFYLAALRRVRPICLTRAQESPSIRGEIPHALAADFYVYTGSRAGSKLESTVHSAGLGLRRLLARSRVPGAERTLRVLHRRIVPRLRRDADPRFFLAWAEDILRCRDARIVHAYFGPVAWRMLSAKRTLGVPLVVTLLGDEIAPTVAPWWSWWIQSESEQPDWPRRFQELLAEADLFLAEGPFMRDRLIELGCSPEKVRVQRMGIPVRELRFRPRRRRPDGKTVIVFAGRFCEQKGVLYALEAFRDLRREGRAVELRLIGDETMTDGIYATQVYSYIRDHGLGDSVRLLGFLNHAECIEELEQGDLFLHPSVVDDAGRSEGGAPTVILEAQALGMPVVSTIHCDIPNVTLPGESALLVPERDSAALADALRTLLDHPERWEAMGRAGRRHVEEFHDVEGLARDLEDIYFSLLPGP